MSAIITSLLYLTIALALVAVVGRALSRSGAAFLPETFGDSSGVALNRLLVVAFYLLSSGFIALTMRFWGHVGTAGQALQLLSGKLGELLLVLGALHVASTVVLARLRRARSWPPAGGPAGFSPRTGRSGGPGPGGLEPGTNDSATPRAGPPDSGASRPAGYPSSGSAGIPADTEAGGVARVTPPFWRPRPRHVVH